MVWWVFAGLVFPQIGRPTGSLVDPSELGIALSAPRLNRTLERGLDPPVNRADLQRPAQGVDEVSSIGPLVRRARRRPIHKLAAITKTAAMTPRTIQSITDRCFGRSVRGQPILKQSFQSPLVMVGAIGLEAMASRM